MEVSSGTQPSSGDSNDVAGHRNRIAFSSGPSSGSSRKERQRIRSNRVRGAGYIRKRNGRYVEPYRSQPHSYNATNDIRLIRYQTEVGASEMKVLIFAKLTNNFRGSVFYEKIDYRGRLQPDRWRASTMLCSNRVHAESYSRASAFRKLCLTLLKRLF